MKFDVLIAGVGGQGVISAAAVLAEAARRHGLDVRQGELHGMSQRGGAVQATVRMDDRRVAAQLIPRGEIDLIIGLEPVEALRYAPALAPGGVIVASSAAVENISDYPDLDEVVAAILAIPGSLAIDAAALARSAGSFRALNVVVLGAAAPRLPLDAALVERCVDELFSGHGGRLLAANRRAFAAGLGAAEPAPV